MLKSQQLINKKRHFLTIIHKHTLVPSIEFSIDLKRNYRIDTGCTFSYSTCIED